MLPLTGYADRLSVRPGETIRFHVANATGGGVDASVVRVICADPNPAGLGIRTTGVAPAGLAEIAPSKVQSPPRGSYAHVHLGGAAANFGDVTMCLTMQVTKAPASMSTIAKLTDGDGKGFSIEIDAAGIISLEFFGQRIAMAKPIDLQRWHLLWWRYASNSNEVVLGHRPLEAGRTRLWSYVTAQGHARPDIRATTVLFGADRMSVPRQFLNGRIERPMLFERALAPAEIDRAFAGEHPTGLVAAWDFSREMHTNRIVDVGPHGLHGTLVNSPTRAVRGSNWTGHEQCFRHAPEQYGAIHFHEDDLDDCHWPVTHEYTVPADLKSGAYALILKSGVVEENIPFFVVPPKGTQGAKLAVLVSTFTYTIYGNHARPEWTADPQWRAAWLAQASEWHAYPHNPAQHPEYGLSTYNYHTDGSGICMASWHRPMLNLRIGYLTYPYPGIRGSGLRHYPADSHLLAWLEHIGQPYDLVTDWELHHEGVDLLRRYTCVMTGTHPEYHTGEMLDALEAYRDGGGRFMYLGGNGFYWKIALSPDKPGLIEIRRAEGGIRAWAAEPGEYYNQFDGEYGGLWRRNGRPPQKLVGVGFTAQGNFVGSHYRIRPEARADPRTAWMLAGIADDTVGGFGYSGHGAAGFELDRADKRLGTPAHAIVVAQSENHPPEAPWVLVPEEQLTHLTTIPGESHKQLIRADMTIFGTPNNGAVFSTGSITYCGSLPHNGFDNSIARLTANVLERFLDPTATFPLDASAAG